jgi:hypothetical protein
VLAFTAAKMIVSEPLLDTLFDAADWPQTAARWGIYGLSILGVLLAGDYATRRAHVSVLPRDAGNAAS